MSVVIFLDIDGVLNHAGWYELLKPRLGTTKPVDWLDPACINRLNRLCTDTGASLVISSSWRTYLAHTEDVLRAAGLTAEVIGATPDDNPVSLDDEARTEKGRWCEIRAWLDAHPEVERWCVIDDLPLVGVPGERFVRTDLAVGLTDEDCARARILL